MSSFVLVVEDDDQIAAPLIRTLEREGYVVERVAAGLPAVQRLSTPGVDLVLLDLGLPDIDGLEVCRRVRADGFAGGVLILTARGGELDRVVGLDVGADDYLAKPFGLAELLARVRALLRRSAPPESLDPTAEAPAPNGAASTGPASPGTTPTTSAPQASGPVSGLRVDTQARRVWVDAVELGVTAKEFDVLALLESKPGAVFTREQVMDEVWDENWFGSTKTLDTTIGRLRQKLEDSAATSRIVTVRGVGFRLESDPPDA